MFERFTERARQVVVSGQLESGLLDDDEICPRHILLGLAQEPGALRGALEQTGPTLDALREYARRGFTRRGRSHGGSGTPFSPEVQLLLRQATNVADEFLNDRVSQDHLALAALRSSKEARDMLGDHVARVRHAVDVAVSVKRGQSISDFDDGPPPSRATPSAPPSSDDLIAGSERPWFVLAEPGVHRARRAEIGAATDERDRWSLASVVVGYGDDDHWLKVGTQRRRPEVLLDESMVQRLALAAAEPGDGEAERNQEAMLARIDQNERAVAWQASQLMVDGEPVAAARSTLGLHALAYAVVDNAIVFVQTCDWSGPTDVVSTRDLATLG